jgi:hypothetical protein
MSIVGGAADYHSFSLLTPKSADYHSPTFLGLVPVLPLPLALVNNKGQRFPALQACTQRAPLG